ncbi:MAG: tetratricopeptide repeat protein [Planctomycetota bacterium]
MVDRRWKLLQHLLCAAGFVVTASMLGAQEPAPSPHPDPPLPPQQGVTPPVSAEAELSLAKKVRAKARGSRGEQRFERLRHAAEAFADVAKHWPQAGPIVVEAHFRRAEILRSLEDPGAARGAFEDAIEAATKDSDYAARALVEIGHLCRRAGRHADALRHYRKARDRDAASLQYRNDGREWLARTYLEVMDWEGAEIFAEDWALHAESTVARIQAEDVRLRALLGRRKLHQVWQELEDLRTEVQPLASAPTREGEAVQRALDGMRVVRALAKARRNGR